MSAHSISMVLVNCFLLDLYSIRKTRDDTLLFEYKSNSNIFKHKHIMRSHERSEGHSLPVGNK